MFYEIESQPLIVRINKFLIANDLVGSASQFSRCFLQRSRGYYNMIRTTGRSPSVGVMLTLRKKLDGASACVQRAETRETLKRLISELEEALDLSVAPISDEYAGMQE